MTHESVYIGLGSNLSNPTTQLIDALDALHHLDNTRIVICSSFYQSQPMGPQDQPDFVNAVAELATSLPPLLLLQALQKIELEHGRERKGQRWGPRTLDLDMLLYGDQVLDFKELVVPHYGLQERAFVLYPLAEIAPNLVLPGGENLKSILNKCPMKGLSRIPMDAEMCEFLSTDRNS